MRLEDPLTVAELTHWAGSALAEADRIDPVLCGAYRSVLRDPTESTAE